MSVISPAVDHEALAVTQTLVENPAPSEAKAEDLKKQIEIMANSLLQHVETADKQLKQNEVRGAKLDLLATDLSGFSSQANVFFANIGKRFDEGVDRNLMQLAKDIDRSFTDKINTGIADGIKEIKELNDANVQKLIDRAVKRNDMSFYLTAVYGLICSVVGCVGYDLLQHNHKYSLWASLPVVVLVFIGLTYYADHRANR